MDVFKLAKERLAKLEQNVKEQTKKAFEEHKALILKYNATEQMYKLGQDSKGSVIRPAYARATVSIKKRKGQPYDRVTLRDTGKFHKTIKVDPQEDRLVITSDLEYSKYLFKKYGDDILGIQDELLKDFVKMYVIPKIQEEQNKLISK